jgi:hypothetical protein
VKAWGAVLWLCSLGALRGKTDVFGYGAGVSVRWGVRCRGKREFSWLRRLGAVLWLYDLGALRGED